MTSIRDTVRQQIETAAKAPAKRSMSTMSMNGISRGDTVIGGGYVGKVTKLAHKTAEVKWIASGKITEVPISKLAKIIKLSGKISRGGVEIG